MAKNYKAVRNVTEKITVKGVLTDDLNSIIIETEDGNETKNINRDVLSHFSGQTVSLTISLSQEHDIISDEDDDED